MNPYLHPHSCERESLSVLMAALSPKQRTVLRSYVRLVEFGQMTLGKWLESEWGVAESTWRKPGRKGGNYYGSEEDGHAGFRAALAAYRTAYAAAELEEEQQAVRRAARKYKLASEEAADTHIDLMRRAEDETVRLKAASEVADRAGVETGRKSSQDHTSQGQQMRMYGVLANPDQWDDDKTDVGAAAVAGGAVEG